jgi:hypothetical protein
MSVSEEGEEDYGFGSEDLPSSDMEMDDSTEYGFDPAEDIDISSRRVSNHACRDVPRGTRSFAARFSGSVQQFLLDVLLLFCSCKRQARLCMMCNTPLHYLLKVSRGSMVTFYSWCAQAAYEVLTEQQMRERQAQDVQSVTSVLGISDGEAARVLRHYKWCALCTPPCCGCMRGSWPPPIPEPHSLTGTGLLTGTQTASTMSTLQTWTTFGTSWGL